MKQQEKANELIIIFDDIKDMKFTRDRDIMKLLENVEKEKKKN